MFIIHNARIHTQNPNQPLATALVIEHGLILAVGGDDQLLPAYSANNTLDARGRTLLPGLIDTHIHLEDYAFAPKVDCDPNPIGMPVKGVLVSTTQLGE
jgi:predicted amidohydrolase YtcJ